MNCKVDGCLKPIAPGRLGFCCGHYKRQYKYGDPTFSPRAKNPVDKNGYRIVWFPDLGKWRLEHILIAEKALGRPLPKGAVVHHMDGGTENRRGNLAVFPSRAYHMLIHRRMRAKAESGNPNYLKCRYCGQWDDPSNLLIVEYRGWVRPHHPRPCPAKSAKR